MEVPAQQIFGHHLIFLCGFALLMLGIMSWPWSEHLMQQSSTNSGEYYGMHIFFFFSVALIKDFEMFRIMFVVRSTLVFTLTGDKPPHLKKFKLGAIVWKFLVFMYLQID